MWYRTAMGALWEALACLEVGAAQGYVVPVEPEMRRRFDHVLGTLMKTRAAAELAAAAGRHGRLSASCAAQRLERLRSILKGGEMDCVRPRVGGAGA